MLVNYLSHYSQCLILEECLPKTVFFKFNFYLHYTLPNSSNTNVSYLLSRLNSLMTQCSKCLTCHSAWQRSATFRPAPQVPQIWNQRRAVLESSPTPAPRSWTADWSGPLWSAAVQTSFLQRQSRSLFNVPQIMPLEGHLYILFNMSLYAQ